MSKRTRRQLSPSQKAELLRKHHVEKVPVTARPRIISDNGPQFVTRMDF